MPYDRWHRIRTCSCGSIIRGHRSQLHKMVAFSVDILSLGNPSLFQEAIWASSVNMVRQSISGVDGIGVYKASRTNDNVFTNFRATCNGMSQLKQAGHNTVVSGNWNLKGAGNNLLKLDRIRWPGLISIGSLQKESMKYITIDFSESVITS